MLAVQIIRDRVKIRGLAVDGDLAAVVAVLLDELVADLTQQILILFSPEPG